VGKPVGVHAADGTTARRYQDAGCTLITVAADATAISRGVTSEIQAARIPR
jgi:2-keto-3-deoxy-L-rhamnonate aldolase RhmA